MISKGNRLVGAILLVSGTTIGAGMLALPVTAGLAGFFPSLLVMGLVWALMLFTALYLLEVNLRLKGEPNIISMVHKTLGRPGEAIAWVIYLLLLYSLISAYMMGASGLLAAFFSPLASWAWPLILFGVFAFFVFCGMSIADFFNRICMAALVLFYVLMLVPGLNLVQVDKFAFVDWKLLMPALSVVSTTFGYHVIIPTITTYLDHDPKALKKAIVIGSVIPLCIYILWQIIVMGILPVQGTVSLTEAAKQSGPATTYLNKIVSSPLLAFSTNLFSLFAIFTSLLGVSLSLRDFLSDGLKIKKSVFGKCLLILLTLVPPLMLTLFYPEGFVASLNYAGIFVIILLAILPTLMAFVERYGRQTERTLLPSTYRVWGGKGLLVVAIILSFVFLGIEVWR